MFHLKEISPYELIRRLWHSSRAYGAGHEVSLIVSCVVAKHADERTESGIRRDP